jgi:predicted acylesterase/phospholipase RssA
MAPAKAVVAAKASRNHAVGEPPKRAIALGGGGPAAGLHIGVLKYLEGQGIKFDVWALSCIGAWVGIVHNLWERGDRSDQTFEFFKNNVFRSDESYKGFPVNSVFGPDWKANTEAMWKFLWSPDSYKNSLVSPDELMESMRRTWAFWTGGAKFSQGDFNHWMLNDVLAVNPLTRFSTSMMYLSDMNGLSKIYYPDSSFLKSIKFDNLPKLENFIYHNAWNLSDKKLELFYNKSVDRADGKKYDEISATSLCACSALPFIESTVQLDKKTYCEGALIDTVNFKDLLENHFDLKEIWINRIVDADQVRRPRDLHDALGNLCELFAATVGEDDVKLFKYHVEFDDIDVKAGPLAGGPPQIWEGKIIEIHVSPHVNFEWTHSNLERGRKEGIEAAKKAHKAYLEAPEDARFINELESEAERRRRRRRRRQHPD